MAKQIIYKITEKDEAEFNKLERAFFEMISLQSLLSNVIMSDSNLTETGKYYTEMYVDKYAELEKQKTSFQEKVLMPVFNNNFNWEADFFNKSIKVDDLNE